MAKITKRNNKSGKNARSNKKIKNVISESQRKKTKFQVEKMNKQQGAMLLDAGEINKQLNKPSGQKDQIKKNALHKSDLLEGHQRDLTIKKQIDQNKKAADDSLMKQIEMMSGFSL